MEVRPSERGTRSQGLSPPDVSVWTDEACHPSRGTANRADVNDGKHRLLTRCSVLKVRPDAKSLLRALDTLGEPRRMGRIAVPDPPSTELTRSNRRSRGYLGEEPSCVSTPSSRANFRRPTCQIDPAS